MSTTITRNYKLVGPEVEKAVAAGLASARWYAPPIGRAELKELMRRADENAHGCSPARMNRGRACDRHIRKA